MIQISLINFSIFFTAFATFLAILWSIKKSVGLVLKTLLFVFMLTLSLKAESLYQGMCVDDFYFKNSRLYYKVSGASSYSNTYFNTTQMNIFIHTIDKYEYINNLCVPKKNDTVFLSSLIGILIGFTILFFSIFLTIKIGAKR